MCATSTASNRQQIEMNLPTITSIKGRAGKTKAGAGEGVLRCLLGKADAIDANNYKLLRRFPDVLFPVVAQDPREAEEARERVVRRVANHRRRVGPLAPAGCGLVL